MSSQYSMYDFIPNILVGEEINTLDMLLADEQSSKKQSMYDILLSYLPQLNGNFETWNLVSKLNTLDKGYNEEELANSLEYFGQISNWLRVALNPSTSIPNRKKIVSINFSEEQKASLLEKLRHITAHDSNCVNFSTIEEFLEYAQKSFSVKIQANQVEENEISLSEYILKLGIYVASESSKMKLKHAMVREYVSVVGNMLKEKYSESNLEDKSELERFKFIEKTLTSKVKFMRYEEFLRTYSSRVREFALQIQQEMNVAATRDDFVRQEILQGLPDYKKRKAKQTSLEHVLYEQSEDIGIPYEDDIQWHIEPYAKPQVICDRYTNYSAGAEINQRVIVVSYGKFYYKMGMIDNAIVQPEIIGVTRIGNDVISNYFAVAPLDNVFFRTTEDLRNSENRMHFANSKWNFDVENHKDVLNESMVPQISTELEEPMVNLLFSDYNMQNAKEKNNFYVGSILMQNGIPELITQDETDKEALYQATQISGNVKFASPDGETTVRKMTLYNFLTSNALATLHYSVLSSCYKTYTKEAKKTDHKGEV